MNTAQLQKDLAWFKQEEKLRHDSDGAQPFIGHAIRLSMDLIEMMDADTNVRAELAAKLREETEAERKLAGLEKQREDVRKVSKNSFQQDLVQIEITRLKAELAIAEQRAKMAEERHNTLVAAAPESRACSKASR